MNLMTNPQRRTIFAEIHRAAAVLGERSDDYRKRIMMEELGVDSFAHVSRTEGYNKLMARIKSDQGDFGEAIRYSSGTVRSYRYLIERAAREIVGDEAQTVSAYVAGILRQMRFSSIEADVLAMRLMRDDGFEDYTEDQLRKVLMALNVQRDRQRAYAGVLSAMRRKRS